jgi:hypothetical protein
MKLSHVLLLAAAVVAVAAPLLTEATGGGGDLSRSTVKPRKGMSGSSGGKKNLANSKCDKDVSHYKNLRKTLKEKYKAGTLTPQEAEKYKRAKICYRRKKPKAARDPSKGPKGAPYVPSEEFKAIKKLAIKGKLPPNRIEEWKQAQEANKARKRQFKLEQCMAGGKTQEQCDTEKANKKAAKKERKETKRLGANNV